MVAGQHRLFGGSRGGFVVGTGITPWTILGWIIALIWSVLEETKPNHD
jgi:hypothetical protein